MNIKNNVFSKYNNPINIILFILIFIVYYIVISYLFNKYFENNTSELLWNYEKNKKTNLTIIIIILISLIMSILSMLIEIDLLIF